jgi:hypothetical protein
VRRIALVVALVATLFVLAAPVAADTTPGGSGTSFFSFSENCSASASRTTCTDTNLNAFTDASGSIVCLDIVTFAPGAKGRPATFDQSGCTGLGTFTVGTDNSVKLATTTISLAKCGPRRCVHPTNYTVSASDAPSGDPTTTITVSTSTTGNCTTVTTTTEVFTPLSGTMTVNGNENAEDGGLDTFTSDSTTC